MVLVGGPAAPYSRALRVARHLAAAGFDVEIAAIAVPGLSTEDVVGDVTVRRYRPRGLWAVLGWSRGFRRWPHPSAATPPPGRTVAEPAADGGEAPGRSWADRLARVVMAIVGPLAAVRRWVFWPHAVRGWWAVLSRELAPADLYHACGVLTIRPALEARRRTPSGPSGGPARVIYDAVDDALSGNAAREMPPPVRAWHRRREDRWARQADGILTVNPALAARFVQRWGRDVVVLPNVPDLPDVDLVARRPDRIRRALGLETDRPIVLFQGRLGPGLGIEALEEAVSSLSGVVLVLLGFGVGYEAVRRRDEHPRYLGRHFTVPAVAPDEVLLWTASADVVAVPLPPISANQRLSTPNKFWEAIVVGTPVVVPAGLTVLAELVRAHDLGVVARSERAPDLAEALRSVLERPIEARAAWRRRIAAAAAREFDPKPAWDRYRSLVADLVGPGADDG